MLSPELLKKIDLLFIKSRRRVTNLFSGEYASAFRGQGIEFEEFREYVAGDDVRQIDWNVTARMERPYVKIFREEREQTIFFVVDVSPSQNFGQRQKKIEVATELAALLAYTAIQNQDKVGLILFSDHIEKYITPKKGKAHVWKLIATLLGHKPQGKTTNITAALRFFISSLKRQTTCFIISDFLDENLSKLPTGQAKHEFIALRVIDELELNTPHDALVSFYDLETQVSFDTDLTSKQNASAHAKHQQEFQEKIRRFLQSYRVDFLDLKTNENYIDTLMHFFLKRERSR